MTATLIPLCLVALGLAKPQTDVDFARAFVACEAADRVVHREDPVFDGYLGRLRTGMLMLAISAHESGFRVDAFNEAGTDTGIMQVRPGAAWGSYTRADILGSADVGFTVGLRALRIVKGACGGDALSWLTAYASGKCGWAMSVARELCSPVLLCEVR